MDLFRNFISSFHKRSLLKPKKTTVITKIKHAEETTQLEPPRDKANDIAQNTIDVEVKATPEINIFNNTKIVKVTSQNNKNMNEEVQERKFGANIKASFSNNASDLRVIERMLNNTSVSIVKVGSNAIKVKVANNDLSTDLNDKTEIDNSICANEASNLKTENINNNKTTVNEKNDSKASTTDLTNSPNMAVVDEVITNVTSTISGNSNDYLNVQNIKEETMKHLKEFDDVLAEVKRQDNAVTNYDAEAITLDDIDDVISESLENIDCTYCFQEIKHYDNESTRDTKIVDSSNRTVGNVLKTDSNKVGNLIDINQISDSTSSKAIAEHNSDIISISSDDTPSLEDEDATNCKNSQNRVLKNEKVTPKKLENVKNLKSNDIQIVDTISISSGEVKSVSEDDTGYHSSDFEFITEEGAKTDGLIIHYKSKSQFNSRVNPDSVAKPSRNRVLNDPGPSSEEFDHKRDYVHVEDENCMENYAVPQENEFLNMFHEIIPGIPNCEIRFLENKSVRTRAPMLVQYDGIGFDMNLAMRGVESSDEEYRDEAKETLNKILQMYPIENTKRKRRRRY